MKQIVLIVIWILCHSCRTPQVKPIEPADQIDGDRIIIPASKVPAYQRGKADARRLAKILRAKTTLKCRAEDGILIFETTRHDLKDRHEFAVDGIISCSVEDHRFEMEYRNKACGFSFRDSGLGFGAGFVAGVVACLIK